MTLPRLRFWAPEALGPSRNLVLLGPSKSEPEEQHDQGHDHDKPSYCKCVFDALFHALLHATLSSGTTNHLTGSMFRLKELVTII